MTDPVDELREVLAGVRRQLLAADVEETRQLADLTDGTLVWLLANHWVPPAAPAPVREDPRSRLVDAFYLTERQYADYRRMVREAQEIKDQLSALEATTATREQVVVLREALRQKARGLRAMSDGWETR